MPARCEAMSADPYEVCPRALEGQEQVHGAELPGAQVGDGGQPGELDLVLAEGVDQGGVRGEAPERPAPVDGLLEAARSDVAAGAAGRRHEAHPHPPSPRRPAGAALGDGADRRALTRMACGAGVGVGSATTRIAGGGAGAVGRTPCSSTESSMRSFSAGTLVSSSAMGGRKAGSPRRACWSSVVDAGVDQRLLVRRRGDRVDVRVAA